jgi:hypothetical protein
VRFQVVTSSPLIDVIVLSVPAWQYCVNNQLIICEKVEDATFFRKLGRLAALSSFLCVFAAACSHKRSRTNHQKNYTMSHHRNKIKRSYNSQYISNGHTMSPWGLNNDISLRGGVEFGAPPPERPNNAAAPPKRKFSNVSTHS